jgi:hypothetical protein
MNFPTHSTNDQFVRDRQRIKSVFAHVAQTALMLKQEILNKNPHAFDSLKLQHVLNIPHTADKSQT